MEAYEVCGLELYSEKSFTQYKRIDYYWSYVEKLIGGDSQPKYTQLFTLAKCILSLSHGNTVPENVFSINRKLIEVHATALSEETIETPRIGMLTV